MQSCNTIKKIKSAHHPRIPYTTTPSGEKVQDWDTAAAIDTNFLAQALAYVRKNGTLPPRLQSKEDQNDATDSGVPDSVVAELRESVAHTLKDTQSAVPTVAFLEGFLLYSASGSKSPLRPVQDQIHLPLFLPAGYSAMKARREGRSGYVTIGAAPVATGGEGVVGGSGKKEGEEIDLEAEDDRPPQNFWVDPPGYVDDVVWPRYVEDHEWLLVADEGVQGDLVKRVGEGLNVREDAGVWVAPGKGEGGMEVVLKWAVDRILEFLQSPSRH